MSKIDYQKLREIAEKTKIAGEAPVMPFDQRINALNDFMKHFSPDIALALLDERERNQQYIKRRDQENEDIALTVGKLRVELEGKDSKIANLTAERDALREGEMGDARHSNTRAAADIYFQLVEECEIPAGGSLVEYVDDMREKLEAAEKRIAELEKSEEQLINERDHAESALADMYFAATGDRPEWSNWFGFSDAVDAVVDRIADLEAKQPSPVVPEEKPMPNPLSMYAVDAVAAIAEVRGWNACRAAMLHGAEPVSQTYKLNELAGNSPVTPDGHVQFSVSLPAAFGGDKYFIDGVFQPLRYERDCERAVVAAGGVVNWVK